MEQASCFWPTFIQYACEVGKCLSVVACTIIVALVVGFVIHHVMENHKRPGLSLVGISIGVALIATAIAAYIHCN